MTLGNTATEEFTNTWRYKLGLGLIVVGHVVLVGGLILPMLGASAAVAGGAVVGGEAISLISIVFLGKDGFMAIKSKVFGFLKAVFTEQVGPVRHYVGIALLCTNLLTTLTLAAFAWTAFDATTPETPIPTVWGLEFAQQKSLYFWLFLTGELTFLVSIYVLGAQWWDRFRSLFVYQPA